jgi:capsular polysaccharide transport system permease protein
VLINFYFVAILLTGILSVLGVDMIFNKQLTSRSDFLRILKTKISEIDRLFLYVVLFPVLISFAYLFFVASDVYISESQLIARSPGNRQDSQFGVMLQSAGFLRSEDDAYAVQSYMLSHDALLALDKKMELRKIFGSEAVDFFKRFNPLGFDGSLERFYLYYQNNIVESDLDTSSSVITLTTRAPTAKESFEINRNIVEQSEQLVNRLNERARQDMIGFALKEVERAQNISRKSAAALSGYRNSKQIIDPEQQSAIPLEHIASLNDQLIAAKAQLNQVQTIAKDNPQISVLKDNVNFLEKQIKSELVKVAGMGGQSLAGKAEKYAALNVEKLAADKILYGAISDLELARNEAQKQQVYLEEIEAPTLPDQSMEPKRIKSFFAVILLSLICWGIASLTVAAVKEHRD